MNKTRILFATIFALAVLLLASACHDLDFPNPNNPDLEETQSIQKLVTGVEGGMRLDGEFYLRVTGIWGRQVYYLEPADPRYTGELFSGPLDAGGFLLTRHWNARYRVAKTCEIILEDYPTDAGATGFARTVKAYQLSLLLNYTYENGIKIVLSEDVTTPVAGLDAAFDEIERLLDDGYDDLLNAGASFSFDLSSGFAGFDTPATFAQLNRAIRARVAMWQNDFDGTLTALQNSFIDPAADLSLGAYHIYSSGPGDRGNNMWEDPESPSLKLVAHPSFADDAEAGDARLTSKTFTRPDTATISFDNLESNLAVTIVSSGFDPWPIIRNEELLLLRAEANIGNGNLGVASDDINIVRAAAGLPGVDLTTGSAADALNQLLYEKRYSLFLEGGHRWSDMRRYDRLDELPNDRENDRVFQQMPLPEDEVVGG